MAPAALTGAGNVTSATAMAGSSVAPAKPANITDNDLLVAPAYFRNSSQTITPPSGWSRVGPLNQTNETFGMWVKPITNAAGEPSSYTFTASQSARFIVSICRIIRADLVNPEDAESALGAYTGTSSVTAPAVTAAELNTLLLAYFINNNNTGTPSVFSAPSGMTEVTQVSVGNSASPTATSAIQLCQQELSSAGSTGTRTANISPAAANSGSFMVTIAPGSYRTPQLASQYASFF